MRLLNFIKGFFKKRILVKNNEIEREIDRYKSLSKNTKVWVEIVPGPKHVIESQGEYREMKFPEFKELPFYPVEHINTKLIPQGKQYAFIKYSLLSHEFDRIEILNNLKEAAEMGWVPVPFIRHPELKEILEKFFPGDDPSQYIGICHKGLVLCDRFLTKKMGAQKYEIIFDSESLNSDKLKVDL